jgi:glycosyltransferase involved in cell wall biosynthesis
MFEHRKVKDITYFFIYFYLSLTFDLYRATPREKHTFLFQRRVAQGETTMKIAQVAPLWERVPPPAYGGIELVVGLLTDELVRRGHDVTLFATGDSVSSAKLESVHPRALRLDSGKDYSVYESLQLSHVYQQASAFDVIHSHMGFAALPFSKLVKIPTVHTLHNTFTVDNSKLYLHAKEQPYISISKSQVEFESHLNCVATVYNAIDVNQHKFFQDADESAYLAFLGRLSPEKGPHHAIAIAKRTGIPLKMAGKVDSVDMEYFERDIKPHIDGEFIQYLGEADHTQKNQLMGRAIATLFPITWREPFGLVMIESMAAGTPVIAMRMGSTPEIINHGVSGYLCNSVDECVESVQKIGSIDRQACRDHVATNFSVARMTDGYEAVYRQVATTVASKNGHARVAQLVY